MALFDRTTNAEGESNRGEALEFYPDSERLKVLSQMPVKGMCKQALHLLHADWGLLRQGRVDGPAFRDLEKAAYA
jgi:hypothetical protein